MAQNTAQDIAYESSPAAAKPDEISSETRLIGIEHKDMKNRINTYEQLLSEQEKLLAQQDAELERLRSDPGQEGLDDAITDLEDKHQRSIEKKAQIEKDKAILDEALAKYEQAHKDDIEKYQQFQENAKDKNVDIKDSFNKASDKEKSQTFREKFKNSQFMSGLAATGRGLAQMMYFDKIRESFSEHVYKPISDKISSVRNTFNDIKGTVRTKVSDFKNHFAEKYAKKAAERDAKSGNAAERAEQMKSFQRSIDPSVNNIYQTMNRVIDMYQSVIDNQTMSDFTKRSMASRIDRMIRPMLKQMKKTPYYSDDSSIVPESAVQGKPTAEQNNTRGSEIYNVENDADKDLDQVVLGLG